VAVAAFEGFLPVITHGVDVVVGEFLTRDVLDPQPGLKFLGVIAHRVQQVGLTQAGTTGDEQRVEGLRGTLRHGNRGGVGEPVERPDHKVLKRVLRVQRHFPVGVVSWGFTRDAQGVGRLWRWFHRSRTGVKTLVEGRHAVGLFPGACALRRLAPLTTNDILPRRLIPWGLLVLGRSMGPDLLLGRVLALMTLMTLMTLVILLPLLVVLILLARVRVVQFLLPGRGWGVGVLAVAGGFHTDRKAE